MSTLFPWLKWLGRRRRDDSINETSMQDTAKTVQLISNLASLVQEYQTELRLKSESDTLEHSNKSPTNKNASNARRNESLPVKNSASVDRERDSSLEQRNESLPEKNNQSVHAASAQDFTQGLQPQTPLAKHHHHLVQEYQLPRIALSAHEVLAQDFMQGLDRICNTVNSSVFQVMHKPELLRCKLLAFIRECQSFETAGKDVKISLGYHYTNIKYEGNIEAHGLLTLRERQKEGLSVLYNGSTHGDGIYTSSNPSAFRNFRKHTKLGLFVLRLSGKTCYHEPKKLHELDQSFDSLMRQIGICRDMLVLRSSSQCLVLGSFQSNHLDERGPASEIMVTHGKLNKLVRDSLGNYFCRPKRGLTKSKTAQNDPKRVRMDPLLAPSQNKKILTDVVRPQGIDHRQSNTSSVLRRSNTINTEKELSRYSVGNEIVRFACLKYMAPSKTLMDGSLRSCCNKLPHSKYSGLRNRPCSVCFEDLYRSSSQLVSLRRCIHVFHRSCLEEAIRFDPKCPICRVNMAQPQGKMPSGSMMIGLDAELDCQGFRPGLGTWRIRYFIKGGEQKKYHPHPGKRFAGIAREAFLPNTERGRQLLKRLTYAFSRGLTFSVGTSLTSGRDDVCTWGSIHHKTKIGEGTHGWPDPSYFLNCNEELDALGVPQHDNPSLEMIFSTKCDSSVNFGYLFSRDGSR